ncbi:MAG: TOBE domain-containing protein [Lutibacter sp.]|nr:TOBE domain-containing protein [Lutibacter sp.]
MNILSGNITSIQGSESLSLVKIAVGNAIFTAIIIDTPESDNYFKIGNKVNVYFKETEVIIAKNEPMNISIQNKILCNIEAIRNGEILSELHLSFGEFKIKSLITTNACKTLNLKNGDAVLALIKTNEVSLSPND